MAAGQARVHPGRRHQNPMQTRNGKPRLGPLNLKQLEALKEKTQQKKNKAKIDREISRRLARLAVA